MGNIMLDLETMGTGSRSAIISIGAVYFDENGLGEEFYERVGLQSCLDAGLVADASTIMWWMQQSVNARKEFLTDYDNQPIGLALVKFTEFCQKGSNNKVWGNGSDFDNAILANAYRTMKMEQPWKFFNSRCFRTLRNLFPDIEIEDIGVAHNALDDAKWQARYAIEALKMLK